MPLGNYQELRIEVLNWLARPGDPLVAPAVPTMIRLFEAEANRRLRVIDAERHAVLTVEPSGFLVLPSDCWAIRAVMWNGMELEYRPPGSGVFWQTGGEPRFYSLLGYNEGTANNLGGLWLEFWLFVGPISSGPIEVIYQVGVPHLGSGRVSNWLLTSHPDAYLFGTMAEAELYIGHDERLPLWLQRRDAVLQSIENYDRKTRSGGPMQVRVHGITMSAGGSGGSAGTAPPVVVADAAVRVVYPSSGDIVTMTAGERALYVNGGPRADLTIRLPPNPTHDFPVEISFWRPVTTLTVTDSAGFPIEEGPTSAYGPGAGLQFRFLVEGMASSWVLWK